MRVAARLHWMQRWLLIGAGVWLLGFGTWVNLWALPAMHDVPISLHPTWLWLGAVAVAAVAMLVWLNGRVRAAQTGLVVLGLVALVPRFTIMGYLPALVMLLVATMVGRPAAHVVAPGRLITPAQKWLTIAGWAWLVLAGLAFETMWFRRGLEVPALGLHPFWMWPVAGAAAGIGTGLWLTGRRQAAIITLTVFSLVSIVPQTFVTGYLPAFWMLLVATMAGGLESSGQDGKEGRGEPDPATA